jgi:hypothetical protein
VELWRKGYVEESPKPGQGPWSPASIPSLNTFTQLVARQPPKGTVTTHYLSTFARGLHQENYLLCLRETKAPCS